MHRGWSKTHRAAMAGVALALAGVIGLSAPAARPVAADASTTTSLAAFVRVNQVGYPTTATKRAYLMASRAEAGVPFIVRDGQGHVVFRSTVGPRLGSWSKAFPYVYALDFGKLSRTGTYRIVVEGAVRTTSPAFRVAAGTSVYGKAMANALRFYQTERDGPDYIPSALRSAPAHLNDATAMTYLPPVYDEDDVLQADLQPLGVTIDASGGWWDAGDYPKFVETTSYTVAMLLTGVRDFPSQLGSGSATADFTAEARFGTDWLLKMWDDSTSTLYYQVGITSGNDTITADHDVWRLAQEDDTFGGADPGTRYLRNRPVFRAGAPGSPVSPNLAGRDAAVFGLCYQVFRVSDPAYAARCLAAGEHVFDLANTNPSGDLVTISPFDGYPETEWRDDLEFGAVELADALAVGTPPDGLPHSDASYYLAKAAHWANAYMTGPGDAGDTLNLYDVSGIAHYELVRAITAAGVPSGLETSRTALLADMRKELDHAVAQAQTDPFRFGFTWAQWDTTTHGTGLSVEASEYDELTHTSRYAEWSTRWLNNVLGANAWGTSLIVGDGTTYPRCLQYQPSNILPWQGGQPIPLVGAAVEGPNSFSATGSLDGMKACPANGKDAFARFNSKTAVWTDNVEAYSNTEPAIDLTATSPLAFARQALGRY
jgi:endoglucanase